MEETALTSGIPSVAAISGPIWAVLLSIDSTPQKIISAVPIFFMAAAKV